jgi:hypothetical protein
VPLHDVPLLDVPLHDVPLLDVPLQDVPPLDVPVLAVCRSRFYLPLMISRRFSFTSFFGFVTRTTGCERGVARE